MKKLVFLCLLFSVLLVVSFSENVSSQFGGGSDDCCGTCLENMCDRLDAVCNSYDSMWDAFCEIAEASVPDDCSFVCGRGNGGPCIAQCPFLGYSCTVLESPIEELLFSPPDCTSLDCALGGCWARKICGPYYYDLDCDGGGNECGGLPCPPPFGGFRRASGWR